MFNLVDVWLLITEEIVQANPRKSKYKAGDYVVVNVVRNNKPVRLLARVVRPNYEADIGRKELNELPLIRRRADKKDIEKFNENQKDAIEVRNACRLEAAALGLNMNIFKAAYSLDNKLILFLYTADGKVDFRELLKRLISKFKKRIELRQVGVRDAAKITAGIGKCGMELCCHRFLYNFNSVSIKHAKIQHLSLNPEKVSGHCGRLLCCIAYEVELYSELNKGLPMEGDTVKYGDKEAKVVNVNVFTRTYTIELDDGTRLDVRREEENVAG